MKAHGIAPIDLVLVNLYAFQATVDKGGDFATCIENIDIGGPSMIRRCVIVALAPPASRRRRRRRHARPPPRPRLASPSAARPRTTRP